MPLSLRLVKKENPVPAPPPPAPDDPALTMARAFQSMLQEQERRLQALLDAQEQRLRAAWREEHDRIARAARVRADLDLPEWLTTKQAAQVLGVEPTTIYGRLQDEALRPEGERPLTDASRPATPLRRRGRGFDKEFNRDALLAMARDAAAEEE